VTDAMRQALIWFKEHNSDGCFAVGAWRGFIAAGENAPFMRVTWNRLLEAGLCELYGKRRMRITKAGFDLIETFKLTGKYKIHATFS